jgi:hypothetical protein
MSTPHGFLIHWTDGENARALWTDQPQFLRDHGLIYLGIAALCLVVALRYLKRALAPIGPLVQAMAAVAIVTLAVSAALVFVVAAAFHTR